MTKGHINPKMETLKLSILFFIMFTACNSVLTIITYIYEQADMAIIGPTNIAVSYLTFVFSTIYAPSCKWKIKNQMLGATIAYTINFSVSCPVFLISVYILEELSLTIKNEQIVDRIRNVVTCCELFSYLGRPTY